jgi:hypothetical protein
MTIKFYFVTDGKTNKYDSNGTTFNNLYKAKKEALRLSMKYYGNKFFVGNMTSSENIGYSGYYIDGRWYSNKKR